MARFTRWYSYVLMAVLLWHGMILAVGTFSKYTQAAFTAQGIGASLWYQIDWNPLGIGLTLGILVLLTVVEIAIYVYFDHVARNYSIR